MFCVADQGEAMERGLRECCKSIRIGHILVQHEEKTHAPQVFYAKLPEDIAQRHVLLMHPVLGM